MIRVLEMDVFSLKQIDNATLCDLVFSLFQWTVKYALRSALVVSAEAIT